MALASWLVPKPSLAAQARLRSDIHTIRKEGPADIPKLLDLTEQLLTQNMHYSTLLRQAIHHISCLEIEQLLAASDDLPHD